MFDMKMLDKHITDAPKLGSYEYGLMGLRDVKDIERIAEFLVGLSEDPILNRWLYTDGG
mgnify:CR=1 FL=1